MEWVKYRCDIRLATDPKKLEELIAKPNFLGRTIYSANLAVVHMTKSRVVLGKPISIIRFEGLRAKMYVLDI